MTVRDRLTQSRHWVVKIGGALLTDNSDRGLDIENVVGDEK